MSTQHEHTGHEHRAGLGPSQTSSIPRQDSDYQIARSRYILNVSCTALYRLGFRIKFLSKRGWLKLMIILVIVQSYIVEISIVSIINDYLPTLVTVALYTWVTHQDPSNSILSICRLYWVFIMRVTSNLNHLHRNETLGCWLFISRC